MTTPWTLILDPPAIDLGNWFCYLNWIIYVSVIPTIGTFMLRALSHVFSHVEICSFHAEKNLALFDVILFVECCCSLHGFSCSFIHSYRVSQINMYTLTLTLIFDMILRTNWILWVLQMGTTNSSINHTFQLALHWFKPVHKNF